MDDLMKTLKVEDISNLSPEVLIEAYKNGYKLEEPDKLDGVLTNDLAVGMNKYGCLEVFAKGTDNALWHNQQTDSKNSWSGWSSLGGEITNSFAVILNKDGYLEVLAKGTDNSMWHIWQTFDKNKWSGWHKLDDKINNKSIKM